MKSETLTKAVKQNKIKTATSSVLVSTTGDLITEVQEEETEETGVSLLEQIINAPQAAKSKKDEDFDDEDDDDDFDDEEDDDFGDDDFEEEDADFEEFDMPKSKPGGSTAGKKKDEDDFELEEDFDNFDDFDDEDDDDF